MRVASAASLAAAVVVAVCCSAHWPLVGDESLMHYVVYLIRQGWVPYREIKDINLPGTYLVESCFMRLLGDGAGAWRVYDGLLLFVASLAYFAVCGRRRWFAACASSGLLILIHLQDGVIEVGQRDLLLSTLLLWACYFLVKASDETKPARGFISAGLLLGFSLQIKPTLLPLVILLPCFLMLRSGEGKRGYRAGKPIVLLLSVAVPSLVAAWWLHHVRALGVFAGQTLPLIRLHGELGKRSLIFLLEHALAPLTPLLVLWAALLFVMRPRWDTERMLLFLCLFATLAGYVIQGKGFTYHRYPQLAIMILILCIDFDRALDAGGYASYAAMVFCVGGCFVLPGRFAWLTSTFSSEDYFRAALVNDISGLHRGELSGRIQCLDTYGGCVDTLYTLRLEQATGFLYDCYLFADDSAEVERYREDFWRAYIGHRPDVIVVTDQFCFSNSVGFHRLERWPQLAMDLKENYTEETEWHSPVQQHFWKRYEDPTAFRIYVRRTADSHEAWRDLYR